jgi:hypothetical protein
LALAWWRLSVPVFSMIVVLVVFNAALYFVVRDGFRQTQPDELASRGIYLDDRSLPVYDPGLRRHWTPMLPGSVTQRTARRHTRPSPVTRQGTGRHPASAKSAGARPRPLGPSMLSSRSARCC